MTSVPSTLPTAPVVSAPGASRGELCVKKFRYLQLSNLAGTDFNVKILELHGREPQKA